MKRLLRTTAVAAALITPMITSIVPEALGDAFVPADVFQVSGGGAIAPGLSVTPAPQVFNFAGAGPAVGTDTSLSLGVANCAANGNDAVGTIEIGEGNLVVSCVIGAHTYVANATFIRLGAAVLVVSAAGVIQLGTGVCAFIPAVPSPVRAYQLICGATYVQA